MAKGKPKSNRVRLIILSAVVCVAFILSCVRLMQYQIVEGATYREAANRKTISTVSVKAPRGEIVDRYGRPLAINKVAFNIIFDRVFMPEGEENSIIVSLIQLMEQSGEDWVDELPITDTKPYQFEEGEDEADINRAKSTLGLNTYATAENCMDELIERYEITGYDDETTRKIAGVRFSMLQADFSPYVQYTFAEDIATSTVTKVKELDYDLPGVDVAEETIRDYVSGDIAPHILGTVGPIYAEEYEEYKEQGYAMNATVGKSGIEKAMEEYLRGTDGVRQVEQNSKGDVVSVAEQKATVPGNTVMLTIDKYFQQDVQNILQNRIENEGDGTAGAIVVLDVSTGEVLAAATYPSYDINEYKTNYAALNSDDGNPLFNRALMGTYRPGSTYKTAVAVGALSEGVIDRNSTVTCHRVYTYWPAPFRPRCTGYHNSISVVRALQVSCNIFFYDVGRRLGIEKENEYAHKLGLAVDTGLEIPTATGVLTSPEYAEAVGREWNAGDVAQASIGQMDTAVTPLQMATQAATIANKGTRYETHIIKSIQSYNYDKLIMETQPVVASTIENKNNTFEIVREGMVAAANNVSELRQYSFDVAIKTGTPQTTETKFYSTVIGFAPAEEPEIAIACVLEQGTSARSVIKPVIDAYYSTQTPTAQEPQQSGTLLK